MMLMARDREYADLLADLEGKRVLIWTCNTCARLCGLGGSEAAGRLAERLRGDGVDVVGTAHTSASCLVPKVASGLDGVADHDIILSLTCDVGSTLAGEVSGSQVMNPVLTFGAGYADADMVPRLRSVVCSKVVQDESLEEAAVRAGVSPGPFV